MKKIMFNDHYGLTKAVLEGRKTMTRRVISAQIHERAFAYRHEYYADTLDAIPEEEALLAFSPFKPGEVVAVAQSYHCLNKSGYVAPEWLDHYCEDSAGYENKMFVRADLMPHHIRITNVRVERLQDISDEDCLREGVCRKIDAHKNPTQFCGFKGTQKLWFSPRDAFAALIDKVSGKGTWQSDPWVFVYEFELYQE